MFIQMRSSSHCKFGACQKSPPIWLAIWVILGIFWSFSLKAHNYYPAYHVRADFSDWTVLALWNFLHKNVLYCGQFYNLLSKGIVCFDHPGYWIRAICLTKYIYFFYCFLRSARSFSFIMGQLTEWKIPGMKFSYSVEPAGKVACFPSLKKSKLTTVDTLLRVLQKIVVLGVVSPFSLTSSTNQSILLMHIILLYFPDRNPDVWSVRTN